MARRRNAEVLALFENVALERGRRLLSRVDWKLRQGEFWGVIGPNGAGKSLLLRTLGGEFPVSRGEVRYSFPGRRSDGKEALDPRDEILRVAFDAQEDLLSGSAGYAQSRWHALEDAEVRRGREVLGTARRTVRGRRLVESLGLERLLERRMTELSNGERRKLLLAREAARGPAVLVLDNPFSGLDASSRRTLGAAVRRLRGHGTTVVLATARADEILSAVTHLLLLDRGRVVCSGPRRSVLADPRFQRLMGAPGARREVRRSSRVPRRSPRGAPVVELCGAALCYGGTSVLGGVDWVVRSGERWVVLGRNGAGKSALLSLVLADNPQSYANEVTLFGAPRGSGETIWEVRRRMGAVSPELHLFHYKSHSALDVVSSGFYDTIGLYRRPARREQEAAASWLRRLGVARCAERRFGELSEGEQQLVLLGRALVKEPELLVLDEPCQGLDAANRERFLRVLDSVLLRSRATLIFVTHDLEEVPAAATHGLVLKRGKKALQGSARSVLAAYSGGRV